MKSLTLREVATAINGYLNNKEFGDMLISGISTDSRDEMSGKLFIPFKGANFDGHNFIKDVFEKGAIASLSEEEKIISDRPIIYVKSIKQAIMDLAEYYRSKFDVKVVGITGSTGKTTTKDMIASVLSQGFNIMKTEGNFNNEIGLPLTIFRLDDTIQYAVIEMGMSDYGEIHNLSKIARPKIGVITNIGVSHIENLGSRDGILKAKTEIFDFMGSGDIAILNADDDMLYSLKGERKNAIFYGMGCNNDFFATDIKPNGINGISFKLNKKNGENIDIDVPVPGNHMVSNSLCAAAVGNEAGLSLQQIKKGIESFKLSNMRMEILKNKSGINIINDAYNANPTSMKAAIDVLAYADGNRICILGDMLELGDYSNDSHYEIGEYAAKINIDYILTFGEKSKFIHEGALSMIESFNSTSYALHFNTKNELLDYVFKQARHGDTVLIKASRGMKFEEISERLINL